MTPVPGAERSAQGEEIRTGKLSRWRGILFDRFLTKIFSLFFAVTVWFYVNTRSQVVEQLVLPVSYEGKPETLALMGNPPDEVEVRVRGREAALRTLNAGAFSVRVDLSGARPGDNLIALGPSNMPFPDDIEIGRVSPRMINVRMEPVITKRLAVIPDLIGRPMEGLRVERVELHPSRVTVQGPRSLLDGLERVRTEPIDIEGARRNFKKKIGLDLAGGRLKVVGAGSEILAKVIIAGS